MSLLVRPAPPLSPFKAAGLRWEVGGDEALTCRYEVLKYKHMKRHDYFPGIESTEFPECYSEFMTKKEWREKINRINKEILAWWSPGNRVRNASYMLGTVCLLVPCLLVYCAMDEVGYFCFVNRKRKQLRDVLGPVCEGLSDENLVWAVEYRRRPQDEAKGPDNEQAENSKAVYVVISRRGMGPARDPMALESDKTPPDTSRVSDEESAGSRGQLTTPPHAVHPERAHSPAGVVSEQPRSPAGDSSPFLPRIGSSNRVLPDPGLGAGEGPGNQRAEPADKSDIEDDSLHSGASASNLLAEVEDLVADLSSKEPQPARPASGAPADVSHAADVTDNSADFADLPDVVDSATATGEAGGLLSELHDMLILSGRGMDSPTDPMGNAAAEGTAQPNYYSMMDDDDIDDAVIQNLSLNDGQSYEQVSARKDEAADAVESFSPADRSQDSVDAFLPRAARGPALSPHASSPQLADLLRGAGEAPPAGNETPTRPVDFPERQSPLELPSLQGASWPSVHEEEEKPTSATLALEAYSAQAPMDDGYAEEDYVHMTSEPNPVPAAAVESPPQYTEDIDGRRPSIDLSDLLGDDWDGDARSPLSNNDFADNTMNVSQGSSLPPLYAQSSDARQPSLDLSDLLGDDWEGNTRPPRSKTDSAVGTPEVEKQFILPEDATPLAQWSQKDYGSGKQNIESQDFSDWLNDIDNILGEGGAGKEDTVSPARAVAPSLSSPPVTTGFRRSPNPEMTPFL